MTDVDRPRLAKLLAVFCEAFNEPVSDLRAEAYFIALQDLPIHALESVQIAALNGKFFPRPRELRELIAPGEWDRQRELKQMRAHSESRKMLES